MSEIERKTNKFTLDWLFRGVLTKLGDAFDRLTGRSWKPSSSLATSELIERVKLLLDSEQKISEESVHFVPHNIRLKMQWDKFATDVDGSIDKLKHELHIAAIDHINDKKYYTYAPFCIEILSDYFTDGVKLTASFEKFDETDQEAEINVSLPNLTVQTTNVQFEKTAGEEVEFEISFVLDGVPKRVGFQLAVGQRKSIGRTKENDVFIDHNSISKIHAAFVFNSSRELVLADTGSTNGTFINGERIAYGRAFALKGGDIVKFGTLEVKLKSLAKIESALEQYLQLNEESSEASADILDSEREEITPEINHSNSNREFPGDSMDFVPAKIDETFDSEKTAPGVFLNLDDEESTY